jgi:ADP-heptose:LPS heptosyltransferase
MSSSSLLHRIQQALLWRIPSSVRFIYRLRARMSGPAFIRLHWPWPLRKPWQRARLRLLSGGGGIGDELMCLPVFREIKRRNPACRITFVSRHPELFAGSRLMDEVVLLKKWENDHGIRLRYGPTFPPPRPLVTLMAECVGLVFEPESVELERLSLPQNVELQATLDAIPRPRVVVQTLTSRWTPNKNWPASHWSELVRLLTAEFHVIEVGTESGLEPGDYGPRFHSFVGKTDVAGLAQIIGGADVFVGPVSGGMHLAAAAQVPSVIIFGGYESPAGHLYLRVVPFYNAVECAPCWLKDGCPYELKCMTGIPPRKVYEAVCSILTMGK